MNTIDAMKQVQSTMRTVNEWICETLPIPTANATKMAIKLEVADATIIEAIKREEAQAVEPVARVMFNEGSPAGAKIANAANALLHQIDIGDFVDSHGHSAKMLKPVHDLMRLLTHPTHPTPPSSSEPAVKQPLSTEREVTELGYLIGRLRHPEKYFRFPEHVTASLVEDCSKAADMLDADAQEIAGWRADQKENLRNQCELQAKINDLKSQQVAVPQGWKLVPVEPTKKMLKSPSNAWPADAKITYDAMLDAAPKPLQAKRVPMTNDKADASR